MCVQRGLNNTQSFHKLYLENKNFTLFGIAARGMREMNVERRWAVKNKVCAEQTKKLIFLYRGNGMWTCECGILIAKKKSESRKVICSISFSFSLKAIFGALTTNKKCSALNFFYLHENWKFADYFSLGFKRKFIIIRIE